MRLVKQDYNNEYEIFVDGDLNDGDCITTKTVLTKEEFEDVLPLLKRLIEVGLKEDYNTYGNFSNDEAHWCSKEEFETLSEYIEIPSDTQLGCNCHTIYTVEIFFLSKEDGYRYQVLLD